MKPAVWLADGLGLGRIPFAPGTFGTLLGIPLYFLLSAFLPWPLYLAVVVATLPVSAWICGVGARHHGVPDPSMVVWDEVVGMLVALTAAPAGWAPVVVAFIAFRAFDILKPFPVGWLDARVPGGWGVLLDDVVAGIYALAVVQLLFHFRPGWAG
jgi:phosphatidylglycerophosphatase A